MSFAVTDTHYEDLVNDLDLIFCYFIACLSLKPFLMNERRLSSNTNGFLLVLLCLLGFHIDPNEHHDLTN